MAVSLCDRASMAAASPAEPLAGALLSVAPGPAVTRLIVLEELERGDLASRLHDGPAQDLIATRYLLDLAVAASARSGAGGAGGAVIEQLAGARTSAHDGLTAVRRMLGSLTARCCDGTGLAVALQVAAEQSGADGVAAAVDADPDDGQLDGLPPACAIVAWRLAQVVLAAAPRPAPPSDRPSVAPPGPLVPVVRARAGDGVLRLDLVVPVAVDPLAPTVARWLERVTLVGGTSTVGPAGITAILPAPAVPSARQPSHPVESP